MTALLNPVTIVLATLCLQWISIGSANGFSLKLPYVAMALIIGYAFTSPRRMTNVLLILRRNAAWLVPFAIYVVIFGLVNMDSPKANSAPRQFLYLIGFTSLAASIAAMRNIAQIFRVGALVGMAAFVIAVEILARRIGLSWIDAVGEFARGNLNFVFYTFFRDIFNSIYADPETLSGSTKNEVAVSMLVLTLLFCSAWTKPGRDIVGMVFMGLAFGIMLLCNTRSVLIAGGISMLVVILIGTLRQPGRSIGPLVLKSMAALTLVVAVAGISLPTQGLSDTLGDRFAFNDDSTSARIEQFHQSLAAIERNPILGNGYFQVGKYVIHNLFLNSWVEGGIIAFLCVVVFYCALVASWIIFMHRVVKSPRSWVLPLAPQWIAPLPVILLFDVWSSGDSGNPFLGEWIALACFFGVWLANDLHRSALVSGARQNILRLIPALRAGLNSAGNLSRGHSTDALDRRA